MRDTTMLPPPPPAKKEKRYVVVCASGELIDDGNVSMRKYYLSRGKRWAGDIPSWSFLLSYVDEFDNRETAAQALRWVRECVSSNVSSWIEEVTE